MTESDPPRLTLSRKDNGREITHKEFAEADYLEPWRHERVNGKLLILPPRSDAYQSAWSGFLEPLIIYYFVTHRGIVERLFYSSWIVIDDLTERVADIAVYFPECNVRSTFPRCTPTMVFEVVNPSLPEVERLAECQRAYEEKRREYTKIGVREYIIVDRFAHRVLVLTLENGEYAERELGANESYTTPLLPGLEIPLAKILE
jgi:Uma2 family endonuclease